MRGAFTLVFARTSFFRPLFGLPIATNFLDWWLKGPAELGENLSSAPPQHMVLAKCGPFPGTTYMGLCIAVELEEEWLLDTFEIHDAQ